MTRTQFTALTNSHQLVSDCHASVAHTDQRRRSVPNSSQVCDTNALPSATLFVPDPGLFTDLAGEARAVRARSKTQLAKVRNHFAAPTQIASVTHHVLVRDSSRDAKGSYGSWSSRT